MKIDLYGDWLNFIFSSRPFAYLGGSWCNGLGIGEFAFGHGIGLADYDAGSRLENYTIIK